MLIFHTLVAIILFPRLLPCEIGFQKKDRDVEKLSVCSDDPSQINAERCIGHLPISKIEEDPKISSATSDLAKSDQIRDLDAEGEEGEDIDRSDSLTSVSHENLDAKKSGITRVDKTIVDKKQNQTNPSNSSHAQELSKSNNNNNNKINKLKFFQPMKISLSSLRLGSNLRTTSKRPDLPTKSSSSTNNTNGNSNNNNINSNYNYNNNSKSTNKDKSNIQLATTEPEFSLNLPFEQMFPYQNHPALMRHPHGNHVNPFANTYMQMQMQQQQHQHHQPQFLQQHNMFNLARPTMIQHPVNQPQHLASINLADNHLNQAQFVQPFSQADQHTAQSMDNYRRIRYTKQQPPGLYFASGSSAQNSIGQFTTNQSLDGNRQQNSNNNANTLIGSAAAALLLTEKAKSLLNQINLMNNNNNNNSNNNNNNNTSSSSQSGNSNANSNNSNGNNKNNIRDSSSNDINMANMLKSAAEAWASSAGSSSPGNTGSGAPATIVIDHEPNDPGTITTVDFAGNNLPGARQPIDEDEDGDVSDFYTDDNDPDSEASRMNRMRIANRPKRTQQFMVDEQQDKQVHHQSIVQHNENPIDYFYKTTNMNTQGADQSAAALLMLAGAAEKKQPSSSSDYQQTDDYTHSSPPRYHHHDQSHTMNMNYPDSINAIKNRENQNHQSETGSQKYQSGSLNSELREKLSSSNDDQIESLIRELQDLKQRKRQNINNSQRNNRSRNNRGRQNSGRLPPLEDYDELSSSENNNNNVNKNDNINNNNNNDNNNNNNNNNDEDEDDDDEETRMLKKKLLARLRNKHERNLRKKQNLQDFDDKVNSFVGSSSSSSSSSSSDQPNFKIPLHALLLAALDRRMSPSEQSQTLAAAAQADALIVDERNKEVVSGAQNDFNEVTSGLGTLLNPDRLYESLLSSTSTSTSTTSTTTTTTSTTTTSTTTTTPAPLSMSFFDNLASNFGGDTMSMLQNDSSPDGNPFDSGNHQLNIVQQHPFDSDKFAIELLPSNASTIATDIAEQTSNHVNMTNINGSVAPTTTMMKTTDTIKNVTNPITFSTITRNSGELQMVMSATTQTPLVSGQNRYDYYRYKRGRNDGSNSDRGMKSTSGENDNSVQQQQQQQQQQDIYHPREITESGGGHRNAEGSPKGRRELKTRMEDGDFDVSKQVEDFSQDNEAPLEPAWMRRRHNHAHEHRERTKTMSNQNPYYTTKNGGGSGASQKRGDGNNRANFDDYDDNGMPRLSSSSSSNGRKRVLQRKRPPPNFDDGGIYDEQEDKFFKKLHKDTNDHADIIDNNSSGIEDPIEMASEERIKARRRITNNSSSDSRGVKEDSDEDGQGGDSSDEDKDEDSEQSSLMSDDAGGTGDRDRDRDEHHKGDHQVEEDRKNRQVSSTWRPSMVDEAVQKLEDEAREKQEARRRRRDQHHHQQRNSDRDQDGELSSSSPSPSSSSSSSPSPSSSSPSLSGGDEN